MKTTYKEAGDFTEKNEFMEIGWSVFDSSIIYKVTTTISSISYGIISIDYRYVNKDGTDYKAKVYRNFSNGFTTI